MVYQRFYMHTFISSVASDFSALLTPDVEEHTEWDSFLSLPANRSSARCNSEKRGSSSISSGGEFLELKMF